MPIRNHPGGSASYVLGMNTHSTRCVPVTEKTTAASITFGGCMQDGEPKRSELMITEWGYCEHGIRCCEHVYELTFPHIPVEDLPDAPIIPETLPSSVFDMAEMFRRDILNGAFYVRDRRPNHSVPRVTPV